MSARCSGSGSDKEARSPIIIPLALAPFTTQERWLAWRWVAGENGKPTKPPYRADAPNRYASTTDPSTWSDLKTAQLAYTTGQCDGIGFVLTNNEIGAFDIDDCREAKTGAIDPWALDKINRSGSYVEITPSQEGVRIIGLAAGNPVNRRLAVPNANGVTGEIYRKATRFITITGNQIGSASALINIDPLIDQTLGELDGERPVRPPKYYVNDERVNPALLRTMMRFVPPTEDRERRIKVGLVIHFCTAGSTEGRAIWFEWLARSEHWQRKNAERTWRGLCPRGDIDFGSIIYWANEANPDWRNELDCEFLALIDIGRNAVLNEALDEAGGVPPPEPELHARQSDRAASSGTGTAESKQQPEKDEGEGGNDDDDEGDDDPDPPPPPPPPPPKPSPSALGEWDAGDDPGFIWPRQWLLANQFCLGFISCLVAAGGVGKSALRLLQYISLALGRSLCGQHVFRRCRVLLISLEDDRDELQRRIAAVLQHYHIPRAELKGWLFCANPNRKKLAVQARHKTRVTGPLEKEIREAIKQHQPLLVGLDPFVKLHSLSENDSGDMDFVCDLLNCIAVEEKIAVDHPHHVHKGVIAPGDADAGRGSSAVPDASRLVYTLTPMSVEEAELFGIAVTERYRFVRLDKAKVNLAPRGGGAEWFELIGVSIGNRTAEYPNGDNIQVAQPWNPPELWADLDDETQNKILDHIDFGLRDENNRPTGERYTDAPSAKTRAAWKVVQLFAPQKNEQQARQIIKEWVRVGVLVSEPYDSPERREKLTGLRVEASKRPGAQPGVI